MKKKVLSIIMLVAGLSFAAQATTYYWNTGTATWATGTWSDNATSGGTTGVLPTSTDSVVFNQSGTNGAETVTLGSSYSVAGVTFNNTGTTILQGNNLTERILTIGSGGLTMNAGAGAVTLGNASSRAGSLALAGSQTWYNNSSSLFRQRLWTTANPVSLSLGANTLTLDGTGTGNWQFEAPITGTGGLIKNGINNTLNLYGTNTYSGGTTISAGNIAVWSATALGTGMVTNKVTTGGQVLSLNSDLTIEGFVSSGGNSTGGTIGSAGPTLYTLTIGAGGLVQNADAINYLDIGNDGNRGTTVKLGTSQTWSNNNSNAARAIRLRTGGSGSPYPTLDLSTNQLTLAGVGNFSMASQIIGTGGIINNNSGTTTLSGTNTYSGGTTVSAGTLVVTNSGNLGAITGALTASGGTLDLGNTSQQVGATTISGGTVSNGTLTGSSYAGQSGTVAAILAGGSSVLTKSTTGILTLSGTNTYGGGTVLNNGTLVANNDSALGSGLLTMAGGTLSNSTGNTLTNSINLSSASTIGVASTKTLSLSGTITNAGSLTKTDAGTLTLSGANTFAGGVSINEGTLSVASINDNLGTATTINIGSGATAGTLNRTGATIETVTKTINLAGTTGGATINNTGTNLTISGHITATGAGSKTLTLTAPDLKAINIIDGVIQDNSPGNTTALTISGGEWRLLGSNTFSGPVLLNGGTVRIGNNQAFGTGSVTFDGSSWALNGTDVVVTNNVTLATGRNVAGNSGGSVVEFAGKLSGSGNLRVNGFAAGTTKLSGDNSGWSGSWTYTGGNNKLQLNNINALGTGTSITFSDNATARGVLESLVDLSGGSGLTQNITLGTSGSSASYPTFKTTADMKLSGVISGASGIGVIKTGAGKLILAGTNTYTGETKVNQGTLVIDGDNSAATGALTVDATATLMGSGIIGGATTVNGNLKPGNSPGTLTFDAALTLGSASTSTFEIGSASVYDILKNDGNDIITFNDGATIVFDTAGYTVNVGDSFQVLNSWTRRDGTLGNLVFEGTNLGGGKSLDTSNFLSNGFVTVIPEPATIGMLGLGALVTILIRRVRTV